MNNKEPVVIWGTVGAIVGWLIQTYLIPDMPDEIMQMVADVAAYFIPVLIGLIFARSKVWSKDTHERELADVRRDLESTTGASK